MPRAADQIFLDLAVKHGALTPEDAEDIVAELGRLEAEGTPSKARILCMELGFIDEGLARQLKNEVRGYLEKKGLEVEVDSRSERRVAGFELMERLGSGAMGVVFKARHLKLDKVVALKLLNPDFAQDERYVARFLQEARVAAALNHANIVQAYDVGQAGDVHYIAMEFVDGKTVKELIERRGKLDEQAAIEIVLQVLDALKHAHSRNLIHRDIKPANIMITREGQAKVLDLGLARRTDIESGLTGEGRAIGTPYFMAPEQALDKGADYRADIYSLGATLFNMVTGEKPYVAGTPVAVMNMHLKAPIPSATEKNPKVSEGLSRVIKKMLAKRPGDRYQDHEAIVRDLEAVLSGLMPELDGGRPPEGVDFISRPQAPTRSRPQGRGEETPRKGLLLITAAASACLILGVGFMAHARSGAPRPTGGEQPVVDAPVQDGKQEREQAASALLGQVRQSTSNRPRPAEDEGRRAEREQADQLMDVAKAYPETEAGKKARAEAQKILADIQDDERRRFTEQQVKLQELQAQGKLVDALAGWERLIKGIEDERMRGEAMAYADAVRVQLRDRIEEIKNESAALARGGREREAAAALRKALPLLAEGRRDELLSKIDMLEGQAAAREAEARARGAREDAARAKEDEQKVAQLAGQVLELVTAGKARDALAAVERAAADVTAPALRSRVAVHEAALRAVVGLEDLAREAFDLFAPGEQVELDRKKGQPVVGKVARAAEDGKLVIALSSRAEVLVGADELSDDALLRLARKRHGASHPPYLHGLAALRLYRGDAEADAAVAKARDAGVDLAALADELRAARARQAPTAGPDETAVADGRPVGGSSLEEENAKIRAEMEAERKRAEREKLLFDNRDKLFTESEDVGVVQGQVQLAYVFARNDRNFGGQEWKRLRGKSYPTPPGQVERLGLVLADNGRAEFMVPVEGDFELKIEFLAPMVSPKDGRLAITADGEGQHLETVLGQLSYQRRGSAPQVNGENQRFAIRATTQHTLELIRQGDRVFTKFGNAVVGSVTVQDLGKTVLGIEWNNASVYLLQITMKVTPEGAWLDKRLN